MTQQATLETDTCACGRESVNTEAVVEQFVETIPAAARVAVVFGSRSRQSAGTARERAEALAVEWERRGISRPDIIVSGGADGADTTAEALALHWGLPAIILTKSGGDSSDAMFRADMSDEQWVVEQVVDYNGGGLVPDVDGADAYHVRNCLMAELVAACGGGGFAIWDGESRGTQRMFSSCEEHGVPYTVWQPEQ